MMDTSKPLSLAPAPSADVSAGSGAQNQEDPGVMPYNCQPCVRRKVKCDRIVPICTSCTRRKVSCYYQAPAPPRPRRRKPSVIEDMNERLTRYERILKEHGLLGTVESSPDTEGTFVTPKDGTAPSSSESRAGSTGSGIVVHEIGTPGGPQNEGKLLASDGRSRYIDSSIWMNAADEEIQAIMDEDNGDGDAGSSAGIGALGNVTDPLSQALLGITYSLTTLYPSHESAMKLWKVYTENVDPLCRVLHIPTISRMVEVVSPCSANATKVQECLLFSIYYAAIHSLHPGDCETLFSEPRAVLLSRFQAAVHQALVNVSFLRTAEMPVMQAYVLYLIACRSTMDPHTYWILVGVAIRLAQRIGLHRDGEALGLPPFEVQMRRRLFWQLLPLDGYSGQMSGTGIFISPNSWDTKMPLNCSDTSIWPGMTSPPVEASGASDMIFVLPKVELSNFYIRTSVSSPSPQGRLGQKSGPELSALISRVESLVEEKYLRYCDIINPLHFLTLAITRSALNMLRLRSSMSYLLSSTLADTQRRSMCTTALKILDTDLALYANPAIRKFRWHLANFFLRDAILTILFSLLKTGFFSTPERDEVWDKIKTIFANHPEPTTSPRAIYVVIARVTLQAWVTNPPTLCVPEPEFITAIRDLRKKREGALDKPFDQREAGSVVKGSVQDGGVADLGFMPQLDTMFDFGAQDFGMESNFNPISINTDWLSWEEELAPIAE
ncbi:mitogen-activated protein kinase [Xylariaceae sp. FL1019]|nr:mitogen-activated protein kinase [Xylariaceae sp. FL1019]